MPLLAKSLVSIAVTTDGKSVAYSKPDWEKSNDAYQVRSDGDSIDLLLDPSKLSFPVTVLFSAMSDQQKYVISALGFAEVTDPGNPPVPKRYTERGPCGGCFTLDDGVGALSVGVVDSGQDARYGYSFKLWLQDPDTGKEIPHDPRIYNRGQIGGGLLSGLRAALRSALLSLRSLFARRA